jgi:hypothetical protein
MKKPQIETGYRVIDGLNMLQYVEEKSKRLGLRSRLLSDWEPHNDSYTKPFIDVEEDVEAGWYSEEKLKDIKAVLKYFPELEDKKTILWICW